MYKHRNVIETVNNIKAYHLYTFRWRQKENVNIVPSLGNALATNIKQMDNWFTASVIPQQSGTLEVAINYNGESVTIHGLSLSLG